MPDTALPRAISLFSGCGGSDYALQKLSYDIVWANDIWQTACDTYKDNLRNPKIECGDIRDFTRFPEASLHNRMLSMSGIHPRGHATLEGGRTQLPISRV